MKLVYILLFGLLPLVHCDCSFPIELCEDYTYFDLLEDALVSDNQTLFMLQQGFFPFIGKVRESKKIIVSVEVGEIGPGSCNSSTSVQTSSAFTPMSNDSGGFDGVWEFRWSRSALLSLVTIDELLQLDSAMASLSVATIVNARKNEHFGFTLHIDSLPCMPGETDIVRPLSTLLSWLRAYARARGVPSSWNEKDKAHVVLAFHHGILDLERGNFRHSFRVMLLILYTALNIQVAAILARFIPQYYPCVMQKLTEGTNPQMKDRLSSIYWAVALVASGFNTLNMIVSLLYYTCTGDTGNWNVLLVLQQPSDPSHTFTDEEAIFIIKIILTSTFVAVELLVALYTTKDSAINFIVPHKMVSILCCCCCCSTKFQSKVVQMIFLWQTMIFIQSLATAAVPIGIFLFVNPQRTISILLLLTTLLLSVTVVLAHLLLVCNGQGNHCKCTKAHMKSCGVIGIEQVVILSFFIFVCVLFLVYIGISWYGTATGGIEELAIPFVSVLVDILIGWHVKRTFFDMHKEAARRILCHDQVPEVEEMRNDEEIPLLQMERTLDNTYM